MNTAEEALRAEREEAVAMASPDHLKEWLIKSKRRYLVIDAIELVDSLPWPEGVEALMQIINVYRQHRAGIPTGNTEVIDGATVAIMKGEGLEPSEIMEAIDFLRAQV